MRAFEDRMLDHLEDLPPPQDQTELERTVRTGLLIERLYARLDVSERKAPPRECTPEEIAARRAEYQRDYRKFLARWDFGLTPPPEPETPTAPVRAPEPSCSDSVSDRGDPFKGHGLVEDSDDALLTGDQVPASDLFGQVFSPP